MQTMMRTYLDHNATSPLRPDVRDAMLAAMALPGNASSLHAEGRVARAVVDEAREAIARAIGCAPRQIVFTSGGTEANVMALSPSWGEGEGLKRLFVSAVEHASVLQGGRFGPDAVEILPVDANGRIDLAAAEQRFAEWHRASQRAPFLVSVMLANNETGVVQPVARIAALARQIGGLVHSDAVQAFGKIALDAAALDVDLLSLSAHKIGGSKGVGVLAILRDGLPVAAMLRGGGQEFGYRAGTENIAAIAGFGAVAAARPMRADEIAGLRDRLEAEAAGVAPGLTVFAQDAPRLPNTSCFAVPGMSAETVLIGLDLEGVAVSAGAACSSGKVARSHVLDAMGVAPDLAEAAIRVSLGWSTTEDDVARFIAAWRKVYSRFAARRRAA
jgi:cysteine desulfurase